MKKAKPKNKIGSSWANYLVEFIYRIAEQLRESGYRVNLVIDPMEGK